MRTRVLRRYGEVLRLIAEGYRNSDIAERLGLSRYGVLSSVKYLLKYLKARSRAHAVAIYADRHPEWLLSLDFTGNRNRRTRSRR